MDGLPRLSVSEVWGEGPLFPRRCWLVRWTLNGSQVASVRQFLLNADVWALMRLLVPELNIKSSVLRQFEHEYRQEFCYEAVLFWQVQFCRLQNLGCPLRPGIKVRGMCFALESSHHEILGDALRFSVNLLWECASRCTEPRSSLPRSCNMNACVWLGLLVSAVVIRGSSSG